MRSRMQRPVTPEPMASSDVVGKEISLEDVRQLTAGRKWRIDFIEHPSSVVGADQVLPTTPGNLAFGCR